MGRKAVNLSYLHELCHALSNRELKMARSLWEKNGSKGRSKVGHLVELLLNTPLAGEKRLLNQQIDQRIGCKDLSNLTHRAISRLHDVLLVSCHPGDFKGEGADLRQKMKVKRDLLVMEMAWERNLTGKLEQQLQETIRMCEALELFSEWEEGLLFKRNLQAQGICRGNQQETERSLKEVRTQRRVLDRINALINTFEATQPPQDPVNLLEAMVRERDLQTAYIEQSQSKRLKLAWDRLELEIYALQGWKSEVLTRSLRLIRFIGTHQMLHGAEQSESIRLRMIARMIGWGDPENALKWLARFPIEDSCRKLHGVQALSLQIRALLQLKRVKEAQDLLFGYQGKVAEIYGAKHEYLGVMYRVYTHFLMNGPSQTIKEINRIPFRKLPRFMVLVLRGLAVVCRKRGRDETKQRELLGLRSLYDRSPELKSCLRSKEILGLLNQIQEKSPENKANRANWDPLGYEILPFEDIAEI